MLFCLLWVDKQPLILAIEAENMGVWERFGVRMIGVDVQAIELTENREAFKQHVSLVLVCMLLDSAIANSFLGRVKKLPNTLDSR
jgi:carbamoyl-phosphate synthase large subunit